MAGNGVVTATPASVVGAAETDGPPATIVVAATRPAPRAIIRLTVSPSELRWRCDATLSENLSNDECAHQCLAGASPNRWRIVREPRISPCQDAQGLLGNPAPDVLLTRLKNPEPDTTGPQEDTRNTIATGAQSATWSVHCWPSQEHGRFSALGFGYQVAGWFRGRSRGPR